MERALPLRILITGATGFIGRHLIEQCRIHYPESTLFGLYNREIPAPTLKRQMVALRADLTDPAELESALEQARPDLVFHLAAQSSVALAWSNPRRTLHVNALGTLNLLELLRQHSPATRLISVGSAEQYGLVRPEQNPLGEDCELRPSNPYGVSKVTQDLYAYQYYATYGLPIIRVRSFLHFGPRQANSFVVASLAYQLARIEANLAKPIITLGDGELRRDFLPVRDAALAYIALANQGRPGEVYNVGSGQARSIREILDCLLLHARVPVHVYEDPERARLLDVPLLQANISRLHSHTGWQPSTDFTTALVEVLDYWRAIVAVCSR